MVISLVFFLQNAIAHEMGITYRSKEDFSWNGFWMGYVCCICFFLVFRLCKSLNTIQQYLITFSGTSLGGAQWQANQKEYDHFAH